MKYWFVLTIWIFLVGCGGGSSSGQGAPTVRPLSYKDNILSPRFSMVLGKFKNSSTQHVVLAHLEHLQPGLTQDAPVKIYQLNADGSIADATSEILGQTVLVRTNYPLVADFNNDGVDDIFLPGFSDTDAQVPSVAFISRPGSSHLRVDLPDPVYAHGAAVIDANHDGYLDVISSQGDIWFYNGQGNFRFQNHSYQSAQFWINGSGVCVGDFNDTGKSQLVLVDQMLDPNIGPIADSVIFELDNSGLPIAQHYLPVPVLDRHTVSKENSHDVTCAAADINSDGQLDILIFSRPWAQPGSRWSNQGTVQVLLNRGNWQFDDVTASSMVSYNQNVLISYTPVVVDLNHDGKQDLWVSNYDFDTGNSNQALINTAAGFEQSQQSLLASFGANGGMLPVKFGDKWAFVYLHMQSQQSIIYFTKPVYSFN